MRQNPATVSMTATPSLALSPVPTSMPVPRLAILLAGALALLLTLFGSTGLAQPLTRKQQAALSGVVSDLDRVERAISLITRADDAATAKKRLDAEGPKMERILADTAVELAALPATQPDVATQLARHRTVSAQFAGVKQSVGAGAQAAAGQAQGWEVYAQSPKYRADQAFVAKVNENIRSPERMYTSDLNLMGNPNGSDYRTKVIQLTTDTAMMQKTLAEMTALYTGYGRSAARDLNAVNSASEAVNNLVLAQTEFKASAANMQQRFANDFQKALDAEVAAKNYLNLADLWSVVNMNRAAVSYIAQLYKILQPSDAAPIEATAKKIEESYKSTLEKIANDVIQANKPPVDRYVNPDLNAIKTLVSQRWLKDFPNEQILAVRVRDEQWQRSSGYEWDKFDLAWKFFDYSTLRASVVVKWDSKHAAAFPIEIMKDHQQGDQIAVRGNRFEPGPTIKILLSKF
jgi:hypothetical protein